MTSEERVAAVAAFGFTTRQARFLEIVMRHAGVCLPRQYAAFAGIVHGQKTRAFFAKLERCGYASSFACRHNRGRVYHVHQRGLYRAIGEANSRYRRPVAARRTAERLMLLDALLESGPIAWLATRMEIRNHFLLERSRAFDGDAITSARALLALESMCVDLVRTGIDLSGRIVLLVLIVPSRWDDFRRFLERGAPLLAEQSGWTLRAVLPRAASHASEGYRQLIRQQWKMLLDDALKSGSGLVELVILNHAYEHLSPVVDVGAIVASRSPQHDDEG